MPPPPSACLGNFSMTDENLSLKHFYCNKEIWLFSFLWEGVLKNYLLFFALKRQLRVISCIQYRGKHPFSDSKSEECLKT